MDTDYFFLVKFFICLLDTENSEEVISHVMLQGMLLQPTSW